MVLFAVDLSFVARLCLFHGLAILRNSGVSRVLRLVFSALRILSNLRAIYARFLCFACLASGFTCFAVACFCFPASEIRGLVSLHGVSCVLRVCVSVCSRVQTNQVGQFLLSSGFVDTDEEAEEKCQALAKSLQKVRVRKRV